MGKKRGIKHDQLVEKALKEWVKALTTTADLALIRSKREAYEKLTGTKTDVEETPFTKWYLLGSTVQGSDQS